MKIIKITTLIAIILSFTNCSVVQKTATPTTNLEKMLKSDEIKEDKKNRLAKHLIENSVIKESINTKYEYNTQNKKGQ